MTHIIKTLKKHFLDMLYMIYFPNLLAGGWQFSAHTLSKYWKSMTHIIKILKKHFLDMLHMIYFSNLPKKTNNYFQKWFW